ncbi:hypothetical protein JTE90_000016 [Oedothorax gibbosus]|uniref:BTB domain-containing protein n=1 Tax=Oedothorax gibbosus TaxID=931172 RepID=A0AAV6TN70_9ARAC|nr:hypothetical protein JTE90_000016 [Oedothorax gibbosus]
MCVDKNVWHYKAFSQINNPEESTYNFDGEYFSFDRFDSEIDCIYSDNNNGSPESFGLGGTSANIPPVPEVEESSDGESRTESSSTIELTKPETSELPIKDSEDNHPFVDVETLNTAEKKVEVKTQDPNTVVVVNGQEFDIHRNLFSEASTYFKEAFAGAENKQLVLHIHSEVTTSAVFDAISNFIYEGIVEIPSKEFLNLMLSSQNLGIQRLNQHCIQLLDPSSNDIKNLLNFYEVVCQLKQERSTVLKMLAHHFETLIIQDDFLAFTAEQVVEVFSQDEIGARSEVVVFAAALEWLNHKYLEREEHIVKIFRCIRFTEMTMEEVVACFHPAILPGVVEMAEIKTMLLNATCYLCAKAVHQEHLFGHLKSSKRTLLL